MLHCRTNGNVRVNSYDRRVRRLNLMPQSMERTRRVDLSSFVHRLRVRHLRKGIILCDFSLYSHHNPAPHPDLHQPSPMTRKDPSLALHIVLPKDSRSTVLRPIDIPVEAKTEMSIRPIARNRKSTRMSDKWNRRLHPSEDSLRRLRGLWSLSIRPSNSRPARVVHPSHLHQGIESTTHPSLL